MNNNELLYATSGDARIALTRAVSPTIIECELTHLARAPIDPIRAAEQHDAYEQLLAGLGCMVQRVEAAPELPDAVFIEDTAIVLPELAVITVPGALSRRRETEAVAAALSGYLPVLRLSDSADDSEPLPTLDGGDVLIVGHTIYVGGSQRSNDRGRAALKEIVARYGYDVVKVAMKDCLHLKTAVTAIADDALIVNPGWVDPRSFDVAYIIEVDPAEPFAGNVLRVGDSLVHDASHRRTRARLVAEGFQVHPIDASELAKAEGGVTCCSILISHSS